jgi:hypothetical protein
MPEKLQPPRAFTSSVERRRDAVWVPTAAGEASDTAWSPFDEARFNQGRRRGDDRVALIGAYYCG